MLRKWSVSLVLSSLLAWCALAALAGPRAQEITIESRSAYIPAGPGEKPFNVTRHLIPLGDVQSGGPPKDGIPALSHPAFISAAQADHALRPSDVIIGVEFGGVAKAYPVRILNWHEIVNDEVGNQAVLVSW